MNSLLRVLALLLVCLLESARAAAPTITDPTSVQGTNGTVTLRATVNPNGADTTVTFRYGLTISYGTTQTATVTAADGTRTVSVELTRLIGGATYHFRVDAANADGSVTGADQTFTVTPYKPTLTLLPVLHAADGTATLRATVTANGTPGTAYFDYGVKPAYGTRTPAAGTPIAATAVDFSVTGTIPPLQDPPDNTFHVYDFRLVFEDAAAAVVAVSANARSNTRPKAAADSETISSEASLSLAVLQNDTDAEGDTLKIKSVTKPRYGTATINAAQTRIIYRPTGALLAADTFNYVVIDGFTGGTATATVTIRPLRAVLAGTHGGFILTSGGKEIGYFRLTATALGSFTGVVVIEGRSYLLSGTFAADGSFHGAASRDGTILPVDLKTEIGDDGTTISARFADGRYTSEVTFTDDEAEQRGPLAGRYTVELPGGGTTSDGTSDPTTNMTADTATTAATLPEGTGWAALKVLGDGSVRVKGRLPDGRVIASRGTLAIGPDGAEITFYDDAEDTRIVGSFTVGDTVAGSLHVDRAKSDDADFPSGYETTITASGARYIPPKDGGGVASSTGDGDEKFSISFSGGGLTTTITRNLRLTDAGRIKVEDRGVENLRIKIDESSGRFSTKATVDDDRRVKGTGVFIQATGDSAGSGAGVFRGAKGTGRIEITPGSTAIPTPTPALVTPIPTPTPIATPIPVQ